MSIPILGVVAFVLLAAAGFAQWRLARLGYAKPGIFAIRALLFLVGAGLGFVAQTYFASPTVPPMLAFVAAFGLVHLPAAIILLLKGKA